MSLKTHQIYSRANSDLLRIDLHNNNVLLSAPQRMALICRIVDEYRAAVGNHPETYRANQVLNQFRY